MSFFVPPGYWLLRDRETKDDLLLRQRLAAGQLRAFRVDRHGNLGWITEQEWISKHGEAMLKFGYWSRWYPEASDGSFCANEFRNADDDLIVIRNLTDEAIFSDAASKGGRPAKYNWEAILIEACRHVHFEGLPPTQEDLIKHLLAWCVRTDGIEPSRSEMQKRVRAIFRAIQKPET